MNSGATAATTAMAALAEAVKASGAIVRIDTEGFSAILSKTDHPLVVMAESTFLGRRYEYLVGYKGFVFYTKTKVPLALTHGAELVRARSIWVPG